MARPGELELPTFWFVVRNGATRHTTGTNEINTGSHLLCAIGRSEEKGKPAHRRLRLLIGFQERLRAAQGLRYL